MLKGSKSKISFVVYGFKSLGSTEKAREFVDLLNRNNLPPLKYDNGERAKYSYEAEGFVKLWIDVENKIGYGSPFIKGSGYYADINWNGIMPYFSIMQVDLKRFSSVDAILNLAKDFYLWSESCYGYVVLDLYENRMYNSGMNILKCIANATWANFFGKPYVDLWGEEKLKNTPAFIKEKLADEGYLIVTTSSPIEKREIADRAENELKQFLGVQYFRNRPVPEESLEFKKPPYEYQAPDFSKYYGTITEFYKIR